MPTARGRCLIAVMVVGGAVIDHNLFPVVTDKIEKAYTYIIIIILLCSYTYIMA